MKNQKGITLVALVVTIVVLLILAGVTIVLVMNPNNSIFGNAQKAGEKTNTGSVKELVGTALVSAQTNYLARDTEKYDGITNFLSTEAGEKFAADFKEEANNVGLKFTAEKLPLTIIVEGEGENAKFKGFQMTSTPVKFGESEKTFNVTIDTSAAPESRVTVSE